MTLQKVHKRGNHAGANLRRQILAAGTTTTHGATTTATSADHAVQNPTGPPLFLSTSTTGAAAAAGTTSTTPTSSTGASTTTSATSTLQTSATSTAPAAATSAASVAANSAVITNTNTAVTTGGSFTFTQPAVISSSSSSTASPTSTGSSGGGTSIGSIAGAAAAAVLGIGVIAAFFVWFIRRRNKNSDPDEEPFNRHSFLRQSVVIPDDGPVPSRNRATPAPNMIERQPSPMYGSTQTFDANQNAFNYNVQPSYGAGQLYAPNAANPFGPGGAPAAPLPPSHDFGMGYEQPGFNNGGYSDLTRGSAIQDYQQSPHLQEPMMSPPLDNPHSPNYPGPETFEAPPPVMMPHHEDHFNGPEPVSGMYAQPNLPELTPAPASAQQGQVVAVSSSVHDGRETPVQLGFAPVPMPNANQTHEQAAHDGNGKKRPDTMYDDDDAYGGI